MTDKELLELAAMAAGYNFSWMDKAQKISLVDFKKWNPIEDDGDALRLAVKLEINIEFYNMHKHHVCVNDYILESLNNDPYSSTRRAIVRAAAEIGKLMIKETKND